MYLDIYRYIRPRLWARDKIAKLNPRSFRQTSMHQRSIIPKNLDRLVILRFCDIRSKNLESEYKFSRSIKRKFFISNKKKKKIRELITNFCCQKKKENVSVLQILAKIRIWNHFQKLEISHAHVYVIYIPI